MKIKFPITYERDSDTMKGEKRIMYKIIYKGVVLFHASNINEALDAILTYATKRGLTFDKKLNFLAEST